MRIVLIDKEEGLKIGGVIVYTQRLYNHLVSRGHKVHILRFSQKNPEEKYIFRIPYHLAESRSYIFIPSEKTLRIIKNYLLRLKPDIVYTTIGLSPLDFLLPSLCHDLKIPIAGIWHADFNYGLSSFQILVKSIFLAYLPYTRQLDLLHVFSQKLACFHKDRGIEKKRILVLPNGVDEKFYTPGPSVFAKRFGIKKGILFLGRLTMQKNPEALLKAFLSLDGNTDAKLVVIGHGELEEELREKYKTKRIIFTGAIRDEKRKRDIMRACQISVLPSRAEGMPLALLEAMACGLTCIASDAGANHDLLDKAGITISSTKLQHELPPVLKLCLDYPEFTKMLGEKAHNKVLREYSQETIFDRLIASLEKTIYDYHRRGSPPSKPIDLNREIGKKLSTIFKRITEINFSV